MKFLILYQIQHYTSNYNVFLCHSLDSLETSQNLQHVGWVWSIIMGVVNYYDVMNTPTSISARDLLAMKRKHPAAGQLSIDGFYKRLITTG